MPTPPSPARVANACAWDEARGVWRLRDGETVPYPNDPFAATALEPILRAAADLSSCSAELHAHGQSWPASYYLNTARTNLLRAFDWPAGAAALEVGAGCGTITRLLGEQLGEVLAVEGEPHRATMAALRTRDQDHVTVLNAPFTDVELTAPFDLVFCIGVLEYAPAFAGSAAAFVERLAAAVAPEGTLVLAIENKLGLKYLAGAAEDHTGVPFDGVEGYRRSGGARAVTFSRSELTALLGEAGFGHVDVYLPFPDYKLPVSVVAPRVATSTSPALAGLVGHAVAPSRPHVAGYPAFAPALAWREVVAAGLLGELANSFLVLASRTAPAAPPAEWDAVGFSTESRRAEFLTRATIRGIGSGHGEVERARMLDARRPAPGPIALGELPYREPWHDRPTVGMDIVAAAQGERCTPADLAAAAQPWIDFLRGQAGPDGRVPGDLLDATPGNLVLDVGEPVFFDRELTAARPLRLRLALVRGLYVALLVASREPGGLVALRRRTMWQVIRDTLAVAGVRVGLRDAVDFGRLEATVQEATSYRSESGPGRVAGLLLNPVGTASATAWPRLLAGAAARRLLRRG